MGLHESMNPFVLVLVLSLSCFFLNVCLAHVRAFFSGNLSDSEAIVSSYGTFRFGFFSPVNSTTRYAGIWYNSIPVQTVIWVANKDKPINDSSGIILVSEDGNLVVTDGQRRVLWSTNVSTQVRAKSTVVAEILDSGNLVLKDANTDAFLWENFKYPTDTNGSVTMSFANDSTLRYFHLDNRGFVIRRDCSEARRNWTVGDQVPATECDIYRKCGQFATCNPRKASPCSCIEGFRPRNLKEWKNGNSSAGCIRNVPLQCERQNNNGTIDGFTRLKQMKLPVQ